MEKHLYNPLAGVAVLPCVAARQRSRSGHGDNGIYRFLCRPFPVPGLPVSPLSAGYGSVFSTVAFLTDIITIKNSTSCSHLTKTG